MALRLGKFFFLNVTNLNRKKVISGGPSLAALLKPDLGDKDSYLNTFLLEENVIGG